MVTYRDPGPLSFDAVVQRADVTGSAAFVELPYDAVELFGTRGRVPVHATFDGAPYRGSLVAYGGPHLVLVRTDIQEQIGKRAGDTVHVELRLDSDERVVELGPDVTTALDDAGLLERFRTMSYSHQREYAQWIDEAKRPATRQSRISRTVDRVRDGLRLR